MEEIEFGKLNQALVMDQTALKYPDKEAIAYKDRSLTWKELRELSIKFAKALLNSGVKKGDRVGIMMTNIPEWAIARIAILRIGAWLVPFNTRYKTHELKMLLEKGEVNTLVFIESALGINFVDLVNTVCPELVENIAGDGNVRIKNLPYLKNLICLGSTDHRGMYSFNDFIESGEKISDSQLSKITASVGPDDVSTLLFTAGTTGKPKGVLTTHSQFLRVFSKAAERFDLTSNDVVLGAPPFFTNFGLCMGLTISELVGAKLVAFEIFDPSEILKGIEEHKITMFCGTPAMYYMLLNHDSFDRNKVKSMRVGDIAGAPVTPDMIREVSEKFGMHLFGVYGLTETTGIITFSEKDDSPELVAGTVGKNLNDGCETKIVATQTLKDLPPGHIGEIVTRGWHVTQGYYKDPELYAKFIDNKGWFHTGDLGSMDSQGYIKFAGRLKDLIISGGMNIDPMEIEIFLTQIPAVESAYIVGIPDQRMGEVVGAFIQLKKDMVCSENEILSFCAGKIAKYKVPKYIKFIKEVEVPRTPVGKVQKFKLRELGI